MGKHSAESQRRLDICMKCNDKIYLTKKECICKYCGCPIKTKTLVDDEKCLIGKW